MAEESQSVTRSDLLVAFAIALVSITTALAMWRGSVVSSAGSDASRRGLIDALKKEAASSENVRQLYEEASIAQRYVLTQAELDAMEKSSDVNAASQAKQLRQFLLPLMQELTPLANNPVYLKKDGSIDLDKRLADLNADYPDLAKLNPQASFDTAGQYSAELRWLMLDIVLFAVALFWLTIGQISKNRLRWTTAGIGAIIYLLGIGVFGIVTVYFYVTRGSL